MSETGAGTDKMKKLIEEATRRKEANEQRIKDDRLKLELEKKEIAKKYAAWSNKYKVIGHSSATVIWDWYKEFSSSERFRQLVEALEKINPQSKIFVSRIHTCKTPAYVFGFSGDHDVSDKQRLSINIAGELYVHNLVKYGKSCPILQSAELLRYVRVQILIAVAKTIADGSIWDNVHIS